MHRSSQGGSAGNLRCLLRLRRLKTSPWGTAGAPTTLPDRSHLEGRFHQRMLELKAKVDLERRGRESCCLTCRNGPGRRAPRGK